jgi:hypothetical protein
MPSVIWKRAVRITDEVEAALAALVASGYDAGKRLGLLRRLHDALTGPDADGLRRKRCGEDPECFEYQSASADPAGGPAYYFTFRVNDTLFANTFVVESVGHRRAGE